MCIKLIDICLFSVKDSPKPPEKVSEVSLLENEIEDLKEELDDLDPESDEYEKKSDKIQKDLDKLKRELRGIFTKLFHLSDSDCSSLLYLFKFVKEIRLRIPSQENIELAEDIVTLFSLCCL